MSKTTAPVTQASLQRGNQAISALLSWRHLAYFVGVPLIVAVYAGMNNWEMQHVAGYPASIVFYLAHSLLPWWMTCVSTTAVMKTLHNWKPPWVLILLLGHTIGCLLVLPYSNWLTGLYISRWPELGLSGSIGDVFSLAFWQYWFRAGVIWLGINYVFDGFIGLPLYRYVIPRGFEKGKSLQESNADDSGWGDRPPGFIKRLPVALEPHEVLAIKAEQHYIKVYSPTKEYMVLYRFSDAVRALSESRGQQVHRSYWVNIDAIESISTRVKDFHIRIKTGVDIPVSTPYQGMVRELARTNQIATRK